VGTWQEADSPERCSATHASAAACAFAMDAARNDSKDSGVLTLDCGVVMSGDVGGFAVESVWLSKRRRRRPTAFMAKPENFFEGRLWTSSKGGGYPVLLKAERHGVSACLSASSAKQRHRQAYDLSARRNRNVYLIRRLMYFHQA
jgi:hypothetical protein